MQNNIAHFISHIRPGGGPKGYLYNLYISQGNKNYDIVFITKSDKREVEENQHSIKGKAKRLISYILPKNVISNNFTPKVYNRDLGFDKDIIDKLRTYQVIVFHNLVEFSYWNKFYKIKNQRCYVFSHCPTDMTNEFILTDSSSHWPKNIKTQMRRQLLLEELRQYELSDGLICPTVYALENYFEGHPDLRQKFERIAKFEILSGVRKLEKVISSANPKKVTYLGRFHESKGFDLFLEASDVSRTQIDWQCGGFGQLESNIKNYSKVTNLGWITNVESVLSETAVLIVPNRTTYFDLVILEAISIGIPVITTNTGGNRVFNSSSNFILCDCNSKDIGEAVDCLITENSSGYSLENERLYESTYTLEKFSLRHNDLANTLIEQRV